MTSTRSRYPQGNYVYGSAVRKEEVRQEIREVKKKRQKTSLRIRRNQERALAVDLPYALALTAAVVCVLFICANYIQINSSVSSRIRRIKTLEESVEQLKEDNDAKEIRINSSIDLERIYRLATEDLGMVSADQGQVLKYRKTESEYVRQYEDIPEH